MADDKPKSADDWLALGKKQFEECQEASSENRDSYKADTAFVRLRDQWPEAIRRQREADGRPCLTIDKLGPVIRQVVNDARQNKPAIKVHPVDSGADVDTAEVMSGLIKNIEYNSNADVAYDRAVECAVSGNVGYIIVNMDYAHDDTFDMDLSIESVPNPLAIFGDNNSLAADSSDWMKAFVVTHMTKEDYEAKYGDEETIDWDDNSWSGWTDDEGVLVAAWWRREEYEKTIVKTTDGHIYDEAQLTEDKDLADAIELKLIELAKDKLGQPLRRVTKCYRVTRRIMSGSKVLKTESWPGQYIPIIPCYGDEFWIDGKRTLRSLINGAKDAQQMLNFWRTAGTELVALAPRVPFIGPVGAFDKDQARWNTANSQSHAYLEYSGPERPQRQPLDSGVAAGSMQEALNASDDIKSITGIHDASLGARSNETSGKAILARQREGDTSTFNFIDNLRRCIRHLGKVVIDLVPHVYTGERVLRIIGEDGEQRAVQINKPYEKTDPKTGQPIVDPMGQPIMAMHDLTTGKYDLTVSSGPSYTTQRLEAQENLTGIIQAYPPAAPVLAPELLKVMDFPGAKKISEKLEKLTEGPQIPPELQQQIEEGQAKLQEQEQTIQQLKTDNSVDRDKVMSAHQLGRDKIQSEHQLGMARIESERQLSLARDDSVEVDGPDGTKTVKAKAEVATDALMQGLTMLGQLIATEGQATRQALEQMTAMAAAPKTITTPDGRAYTAETRLN